MAVATGLLVLKELGIEIERYVALEIDPDSVKFIKLGTITTKMNSISNRRRRPYSLCGWMGRSK